MNIVFRCDASIQIGTGHVMRCLTLADALKSEGVESHFICREHTGHLLELIERRGYQSHCLPYNSQVKPPNKGNLEHTSWLGVTQQEDAGLCAELLQRLKPDWLIVDHYALDIFWESALRPYCNKIMVIDDLADRQHDCDVLLDQTFGRDKQDYAIWVPKHCLLLCGANYALLRPEFTQWREYSLKRRKKGQLEHVLINLGGVDKENVTTQILKKIPNNALPEHCRITVVMGSTAPWVDIVQEQAVLMPWLTEVKTGVSNMAELMANTDLAIGAAGSTSWERCCLGLPSLVLCLANNQKKVISMLEKAGVSLTLSLEELNMPTDAVLYSKLITLDMNSSSFTAKAIKVTNGSGSQKVMRYLGVFA